MCDLLKQTDEKTFKSSAGSLLQEWFSSILIFILFYFLNKISFF